MGTAFDRIADGKPAELIEAALAFARDEYPDVEVSEYRTLLLLWADQFTHSLPFAVCGGTAEERTPGKEPPEPFGDGGERGKHSLGPTADRPPLPEDPPPSPVPDPRAVLALLNRFFFDELGFQGDTRNYYDPRNSYLNEVLDRRLGIPISLSVVYQFLARAMGVSLWGVNLPGHFMLAGVDGHGERFYVDLFRQGQLLMWPQCQRRLKQVGLTDQVAERDFPPMTNRQILARMLRNLKGIYSRQSLAQCLMVQRRLVRLLPNDPLELRDLGVLYLQLEKPMLAMRALQEVMMRFPEVGCTNAVRGYLAKATREAVLCN